MSRVHHNKEAHTCSDLRSNTCGIMFRHIEEGIRGVQDTRQRGRYAGELDYVDVAEGLVHGPKPLSRKPEHDDALMDLRKFRRIQLIDKSLHRRGRIRQRSMESLDGG